VTVYENQIDRWVELAVASIRFPRDRKVVAAELREHVEDKVADLMRIFPGMSRSEATQRALSQMGDAREIGKELGRIHKPWLGYIWRVTQVVMILVLMTAAFRWGSWAWYEVENWWQYRDGIGYMEYLDECYITGKDPFDESSPWYDPAQPETGIVRTPLRTWRPEGSARTKHYLFRPGRAALWSFTDKDGEEDWWLYMELKVSGLPWEPLSQGAAWHISATDNLGNYYYNSYETYELRLERDEDESYVMINTEDMGFFTQTLRLQISAFPVGVEWLRLNLDRGGESWSMTIPLKEVGA